MTLGYGNLERGDRLPQGPGEYDDLATLARVTTKADGVIVAIFGGNQGSGISVQGPVELHVQMPKLLRRIADQLEAMHNGEKAPEDNKHC